MDQHLMTRKRLVSFGIAILLAGISRANCGSIDSAVVNAPNQFSSFKGAKDPDGDGTSFHTTWLFSEFDECSVERDDDGRYSLFCSQNTDSFDSAKANAERIAADIQSCLQKRGPVKSEDWHDGNMDLPSSSSRSHSKTLLAPTPNSAYDAQMYVSGACTLSKKRGTERCRVSLSIERKDD